jgi:type IV pilus assembly protein PilO
MSARPVTSWRERLASPLTWHVAGCAVIAVATLVLGIRFGLDWAATSGSIAEELAGKQVRLKALELETAPLRGLDKKVADSRQQVQDFYTGRIPPNYSSISTRVGELEVQSGARLSRMQYTQGKPESNLTEITLDAGISGEYPQIMRFVNSLERDKLFFVVKQMQLTGQQGGIVNLRLQVSTWLRPADAAASGLPQTTPQTNPAPATAPAPAGEGE